LADIPEDLKKLCVELLEIPIQPGARPQPPSASGLERPLAPPVGAVVADPELSLIGRQPQLATLARLTGSDEGRSCRRRQTCSANRESARVRFSERFANAWRVPIQTLSCCRADVMKTKPFRSRRWMTSSTALAGT
jgi:hypothetical protein